MLKTNIYFNLFNELLTKAETLYGQRDKSYIIDDIIFVKVDRPYICYPSTKHIEIRLTEDCKYDINQATYQLSHEVIHCLHPNNKADVTFLEEGVAVYFSVNSTINLQPSIDKYKLAYLSICNLLEYDKYIIEKACALESNMSKITSELLLSLNSNIDAKLLLVLTKKFYPEVTT